MRQPRIQPPYQTLLQKGDCELVIKQSRFIGFAEPLDEDNDSEEKIQYADAVLTHIRKQYHDARHVCFAYRVKNTNTDQVYEKYSDDGEPIRTGGFPILQLLQGRGLENVLVIVVRYFGGTKLGPGGLARAYRDCARQSVEKGGVQTIVPKEEIKWVLPYADLSSLEHWLKSKDAIEICKKEFNQNINITFSIRSDLFQESLDALSAYLNITSQTLIEKSLILHERALDLKSDSETI